MTTPHQSEAASRSAELPVRSTSVGRERIGREPLLRRLLAIADAAAGLAVAVSLGIASGDFNQFLWSSVFVPVWVLLAKIHGQYDRDNKSLRHLTTDELPNIAVWATSGTGLMALFLSLTPADGLSASGAVQVWCVAVASVVVFRSLARMTWRRITPPARALIIGSGAATAAARRKLELFGDIHVQVVAEKRELTIDEIGSRADGIAAIDRLIVATPRIDEDLMAALMAFCRREHIRLTVVPPLRRMFGTAAALNHVADLPTVEFTTWDVSRSTLLLKRTMDVTVSALALLLLAPLLLLISTAIVVDSAGPVLFKQRRAGRGGRPFTMLKFRTMVSDAEAQLPNLVPFDALAEPMFKLRRDPRVTRIGRVLRRASLDELPQLLNVLKGDMSLVGPRPEQIDLVERYAPEHRFRLAVRPGVTGPMQVFGRGELTFEERLAVERQYIDHLSLSQDLRLLAMTIGPVVSGRGAY
jgi:exopolysaccharide biosynthesis polyprenyl glycosylphosphotransferase